MDKPARLGWRFENATKSDPVRLLLFGVIGDAYEGVTGADFVRDWRDATRDKPPVEMTINSPGGYVDDALGIYNEILQYPGEVTANIVIARSAATFIAMAADVRNIAKTGEFMIHDAIIPLFALVNSGSLESLYAELKPLLESESQNIASVYADRAGGTVESWSERMQANGLNGTSYRGKEAVDVGLVHGLIPTRNESRIAAMVASPEPKPDVVEIDLSLIPPMANGYSKPMPADFTHLLEANLAAATKGA